MKRKYLNKFFNMNVYIKKKKKNCILTMWDSLGDTFKEQQLKETMLDWS